MHSAANSRLPGSPGLQALVGEQQGERLVSGRTVATTFVPPSWTAAICQVSWVMAAAATSGPSGCAHSDVVGAMR